MDFFEGVTIRTEPYKGRIATSICPLRDSAVSVAPVGALPSPFSAKGLSDEADLSSDDEDDQYLVPALIAQRKAVEAATHAKAAAHALAVITQQKARASVCLPGQKKEISKCRKRKTMDARLNQAKTIEYRKRSFPGLKTFFIKSAPRARAVPDEESVRLILCPLIPMLKIKEIMGKVETKTTARLDEYTLPRRNTLEINENRKCRVCGNKDNFVEDKKEASLVCKECGGVQKIGQIHRGEWALGKTEEGVPRHQHGLPFNPLLSHLANMRTSISRGGSSVNHANFTTRRNSCSLRQSQQYVDLNAADLNLGAHEGTRRSRTRIGYKDQMKLKAFHDMNHVKLHLNLHDQVIRRARVFFACYRDFLEAMHTPKAVIAACIILSMKNIRETQYGRLDLEERGVTLQPGYVRRRFKLGSKSS